MRRHLIFCTLPLLALAACHAKVDVGDADESGDGNVHVAMGDTGKGNKVSIDVPGFNANLSLPDINLAGHLDLDGIKLAPNSKVGSFDITAHETDSAKGDDKEGNVRVGFTDSGTPAAVIDHYARSAADAGYEGIARTATSLTAHKSDKIFAVEVAPKGAGSAGTITISDKK